MSDVSIAIKTIKEEVRVNRRELKSVQGTLLFICFMLVMIWIRVGISKYNPHTP